MTFSEIGVGASANDETGDPLRTAMLKVNSNFNFLAITPEKYGAEGDGTTDDSDALEEAAEAAHASGGKLLLRQTYGIARPVSLLANIIECPGSIKLLSGCDSGADSGTAAITLGQDIGVTGRGKVDLYVDGNSLRGALTAAWDADAGTFPSGSTANNCYIVRTAGTVGGVSFAVGDRLIALVTSASTTVYAGNWVKKSALIAAQVRNSATPHTRYTIGGNNCDILLDVYNNTERAHFEVSGYRCAITARERSDVSSPDSNSYFIRDSSCAQHFVSTGTTVSQIRFDTQASLSNFGLPPVHITSDRIKTLSGHMRTPQYGGIVIEQDPSAAETAVIFGNLTIIAPVNSPEAAIHVKSARWLQGSVYLTECDKGVRIDECRGALLNIGMERQTSGTLLTLGRTSTGKTAQRARINLHHAVNDGATQAIESQSAAICDIHYTGVVLPVTHTAGEGTRYTAPAEMISGNVAFTVTPTEGTTVEFIGPVDQADVQAYSTPHRGMQARLKDRLQVPIFYTARGNTNGWQIPAMYDGQVAGNSFSRGVMTQTGNGATASYNVTHNLVSAPTTVILSPGNADSAAAYVSAKGSSNFTITFPSAPSNGAAISVDWLAIL